MNVFEANSCSEDQSKRIKIILLSFKSMGVLARDIGILLQLASLIVKPHLIKYHTKEQQSRSVKNEIRRII